MKLIKVDDLLNEMEKELAGTYAIRMAVMEKLERCIRATEFGHDLFDLDGFERDFRNTDYVRLELGQDKANDICQMLRQYAKDPSKIFEYPRWCGVRRQVGLDFERDKMRLINPYEMCGHIMQNIMVMQRQIVVEEKMYPDGPKVYFIFEVLGCENRMFYAYTGDPQKFIGYPIKVSYNNSSISFVHGTDILTVSYTGVLQAYVYEGGE